MTPPANDEKRLFSMVAKEAAVGLEDALYEVKKIADGLDAANQQMTRSTTRPAQNRDEPFRLGQVCR